VAPEYVSFLKLKITSHDDLSFYFIFYIKTIGNAIGDKGAQSLAEVLKLKNVLQGLAISCKWPNR
jgi:hypothetical protein